MIGSSKKFLLTGIILITLILVPINRKEVLASPGWGQPDWIPGLVDTTLTQYPYFITDTTGRLHVFHSQWVNGSFGIMYSYWVQGVGWAEPIDIIFAEQGQARITGAFLDESGMVNVFFWGGDQIRADMYFTQAPIRMVGSSQSWSKPILIGMRAISPTTASVLSNGQGYIVLLYSGNASGNGLYSVISQDGGVSWTSPTQVFSAGNDFLWPSELNLILGTNEIVHAVWALADDKGNSLRIYYAKLERSLGAWSGPIILAQAIGYEADTPSIIEHEGNLQVIYHNGFPTTRWMIRSDNSGLTWTKPTRLFEHVGSNGSAALVVDSAGVLHVFFGNRIGSPPIQGVWHSMWLEGSWSNPEPVISGFERLVGASGEEGFAPSHAQAVVIRGNLMLVVWRQDPIAGPLHIWYSYATLDAPELPAGTLPPPITTSKIEHTPFVTGIPTPTSPVSDIRYTSTESRNSSPNSVVSLSVLPALVLVLLIIILLIRTRR